MSNNDTERNRTSAEPQPESTAANGSFSALPKRGARDFSVRIRNAGYLAGRKYDAVKNAFLSYKTGSARPKPVRSRITRSGETFGSGGKTLGKISMVGGYLRLFLPLDPNAYSAGKYHHKDCTQIACYSKIPFMIKLSSDRQVKYAASLIADVMRENGLVPNAGYTPCDQAQIFGKPDKVAFGGAFAVRMWTAGYITGRQYDAVKNAFLSYKPRSGKNRVRSRVSAGGETFCCGRKMLGKICLVGGYLRVFLALEPKDYITGKYHHRDYTEVSCYAKIPFMIKISSDRQLKYVRELIADVMRESGLVPDKTYVSADQAHIFKRPKPGGAAAAGASPVSDGTDALSLGLPQEEDGAEEDLSAYSDEDGAETDPDGQEVAAALAGSDEDTEEGEDGAEDGGDAEEDGLAPAVSAASETPDAESAAEEVQEEVQEEPLLPYGGIEAIDVRVPGRAIVVNKQGEKIGKIRRSVWYDTEGECRGRFSKGETNVFWLQEKYRSGYVDKNNNVLTLTDEYVATIRYPRFWLILVLLLFLFLVSLLTTFMVAYYMTGSEPYAPTIFIASEDGVSWEDTENLPIFLNGEFGDGIVVPGQSGSYRFTFENRNSDTVEYNLTFSETNEYNIGMYYRLCRDGAYIAGVDDYVSVEALSFTDLTIEAKSSTVFSLEWYWEDNDAVDTLAGENEAVYTLNIDLLAWVKGADAAA